MAIQKNDIVTLKITGTTSEGNGVGRHEGMAVFIPAAAEGDELKARIVKVNKNYAFGRIEEILKPAPWRQDSDCPQFPKCGGCAFRHIIYKKELEIKEKRVEECLRRIGGFEEFAVNPIIGAEFPDGYRNKAQLPVGTSPEGGMEAGFYAARSHRMIPCRDCKLQPKMFSEIAAKFLQWCGEKGIEPYDEAKGKGRLRHLYLRQAKPSGKIMVCAVVNGNGIPGEKELAEELSRGFPQIESFVINSNREQTNVILGKKCRTVFGKGYLTDTLCGLSFDISPLSFYQINHDQAQRLYEIAASYAGLTGKELLLDLYCGTGTIGLSMARQAEKLIGVEIIPEAVENAKENAAKNGIKNCEFFCADASQAAKQLAERGERPGVVVLDPPRKGCGEGLIQVISRQMKPDRIVYVSCDPGTLARDARLFCEEGYCLRKAVPVDMFPRTAHVETVVLLSRM